MSRSPSFQHLPLVEQALQIVHGPRPQPYTFYDALSYIYKLDRNTDSNKVPLYPLDPLPQNITIAKKQRHVGCVDVCKNTRKYNDRELAMRSTR